MADEDAKTLLAAENAAETAEAAEGTAEGGEEKKQAEPKKEGEGEGGSAGEPKGESAERRPVVVKVPEGFVPDDPAIGKFSEMAAEYGLDDAKAQKLVDMHFEQLKAVAEAQAAEHRKAVVSWEQSVREDPEMGGAKFDETLERGRSAVRRFGSPKLSEFLDASGLGSHPEFVRFAAKVGAAIREDEAAAKAAGGARSGGSTADDPMLALYTSMRKE